MADFGFYVTAQCSQDVNEHGWHTRPVFAKDQADALRRFNEEADAKADQGWRRASIEGVVRSRTQ